MQIWDPTSQLLYDSRREAELMDILGIQSMDEITIVPWRPPTTPPMEASYVFVKHLDPGFDVITFDFFAYENGTYTYFYGNGGSFDLPLSQVLGWAYPINYRAQPPDIPAAVPAFLSTSGFCRSRQSCRRPSPVSSSTRVHTCSKYSLS